MASPSTQPATKPHAAYKAGDPVRILVVDDSVVMRQLITRMLTGDAAFQVIGTARNGRDALDKIEQLKPDMCTLDVEMPELDGIGAMKEIARRFPQVRVIMCSSLTERGASTTIDALLAGADDYVTKQHSGEMAASAYDELSLSLRTKIRQLFRLAPMPGGEPVRSPEMPVRGAAAVSAPVSAGVARPAVAAAAAPPWKPAGMPLKLGCPQILAIGVSTGGPSALADLLPMIPASFPLPIVIVQHMPPYFTQLLAERLTKLSSIEVVEAAEGTEIKPGRAVLAPGNYHMKLVRRDGKVLATLNQDPQENSCRPAVDVLFRSVGELYGGSVIATILTGMGQDGLLGVKALKSLGASVVVQDAATSVVWGMPGAVADAKLADAVLPLKQIVPEILRQI